MCDGEGILFAIETQAYGIPSTTRTVELSTNTLPSHLDEFFRREECNPGTRMPLCHEGTEGNLTLSSSRVAKLRKALLHHPHIGFEAGEDVCDTDSTLHSPFENDPTKKIKELPEQNTQELSSPMQPWNFEFVPQRSAFSRIRIRETGISEQNRGDLWKQLVGKGEGYDFPYYEELVKEAADDESDRRIEMALAQFAKESRASFNSWHDLKQLLKACSSFTLNSGRRPLEAVTPLAFIGAILLSYLQAKEVFYLLASMCLKPCYALPGVLGLGDTLHIFCCIHDRFVASFLPVLAAHFRKEMVCCTHYGKKWFSSLFTQCLSKDYVARIWDLYLSDGIKIIFRVAIVLLQLHQNVLLDLDFGKIVQRLHYLGDRLSVSPQELVELSLNLKITTTKLEKERRKVKVLA